MPYPGTLSVLTLPPPPLPLSLSHTHTTHTSLLHPSSSTAFSIPDTFSLHIHTHPFLLLPSTFPLVTLTKIHYTKPLQIRFSLSLTVYKGSQCSFASAPEHSRCSSLHFHISKATTTPQKLKPEPDSPPPPPLSNIQIVASIPNNCSRRRDAREAGKYVCMQHIQQREDRSGASSRRQGRSEHPLSPPFPPPLHPGDLGEHDGSIPPRAKTRPSTRPSFSGGYSSHVRKRTPGLSLVSFY
jgi:hypothetical protein